MRINPLNPAQVEWERATTPYPLPHRLSYGEVSEEPFREYAGAIAVLEWDSLCLISKIETLKPRSGSAAKLLSFLKSLSVKHGFHIFGNPVVYPPVSPQAAQSPLTQDQLYNWYAKNDFVVCTSLRGVPELWFPDRPKL